MSLKYSPLQTINLDGLRLAYRTQGCGRDVVLIHGWVSSSRMWQAMMDTLAARFRFWALDLPGFGDSDKPDGDWYSIPKYVALASEFITKMNLRQPDVIGHSMGGMIALTLAVEQPAQVRRLIAINPIITGRTYLDLRLLGGTPFSQTMFTLGRWFWPVTSSDVVRVLLGADRSIHYERLREDWGKATSDSAVSTARAIGQNDLTACLPKVATPTLVIIGSRDLTAPNAEGRLAARRIPNARLAVLPAGHLPTDDLPDETNALVSGFLSTDTCTSTQVLVQVSVG